MGTVYRAEHLVLQAPVAIKVIDREVADGDLALSRFMREAQAAASLRSPHVVQILDYGTEEDRPFMVMELLEGETLADRIDRLGRLGPQETYRVMSHVARAVSKAHEAGIVHRDLKPDNVFLVFNEGDEIAKVLDFGVAKIEATALEGASHTRTGSLLGTPYYMSPEQAQGNKEIDHRSDLWALCVIAFECLTGQKPFSSEGLGDLVLQICIRDIPVPSQYADVPEGFDEWFAQGTQREPDDRFQSARELSEALREALGIHRDTSIPDGVWSARAASAGAATRAKRVDARATTDPDRQETMVDEPMGASRRRTPSEDGPSIETKIVPESTDTLVESGAAQRGSQWQVVPHESDEEPESQTPAVTGDGRLTSDSATMVLPTRNSGMTVVWVGAVAVLTGVVAVWGARQLGFDPLQTGRPARNQPVDISVRAEDEPEGGAKGQQSKRAASTGPADTEKTKSGARGASSASDSEESTDSAEEEPGAGEEGEPTEDELLDAIEQAAKESIEGTDETPEDTAVTPSSKKEGDSTEGAPAETPPEKKPQKSDDAAPAEGKVEKKKDPGPKPEVPDTLNPAPPPPPPTE